MRKTPFVAFLGSVLFAAHAIADTQTFDIPAGDLNMALQLFAKQADVDLVYQDQQVKGLRTGGVTGDLSSHDAVIELLKGTRLEVRQDEVSGAILITKPRTSEGRNAPGKHSSASQGESGGQDPENATANRQSADRAPRQRSTELEEVLVTGSHIRGGITSSPVVTIDSERIQQEGFADLGEVIRSVPQNFNGGQNPGVAVGATSGAGGIANQNVTGGSSLNLRGLGPDATLTLLNGRRLAYGGVVQAVDFSAIPVEAVDRIEIVPDGASAVYGSDAVGGVANVILKSDFDGVTLGARYGGATAGGLATREYTATVGTTWAGGGFIATYKDVSTDPIYARQRGYTGDMFDPTTLYPGSDLRSGLVSLHQLITDSVEFRLDAFRTRRQQAMYPWNTGLLPYYYQVASQTTTSLVSPNIQISLAGGWTLSAGGSWGRDEHVQNQSAVDIATGAPTALIRDCYCNDALSYEISAEGPLFAMPGGDARLAVGAGSRRNEFVQKNYLAGMTAIDGDESSRFAYAEVSLPLIGPRSAVAGVRRLDLTAAVRGEDYDSFGSVTTPKVGLIYDPDSDFTLKASWGKSFKAPTLFQLHQAQTAELDPAGFYGGSDYGPEATVLSLWGGNRDLDAERATTWTVSSAFHPEALAAFEAELTWFDIDYTDRVVQPITDYGHALGNPNDAQFIDYSPAVQELEGLLAAANAFYNFAGKPYDPDDVVAIMYAQYVNVARQRVKGLDLSSSYRFDFGPGRLTVRGSATWLDSSQQNTAAQKAYEVAGTIFNPAKVKGRFGAVWSQGGFVASTFVNYTSGVRDSANDRKIASFTTFDATLRYAIDERTGALSGLEFALSAQNLFNRDPPLYVPATPDRPPYDSTNYSAIGRFLGFSVSKHW